MTVVVINRAPTSSFVIARRHHQRHHHHHHHHRFPRHNDQHKMTTTRKAILAFATEEEHEENGGNLFMGMDFGTSGCRVSLIDERGVQKFETSVRYTDTREANATKETSSSSSSMTAIWEDALWTSLENIPRQIRERIVSVAIDGTSGTVIIVHPDSGEPLYKAMMYNEKFEAGAQHLASERYRVPDGHVTRSSTSALSKLAHYFANENPKPNSYKLLHHADWLSYKLHEIMGVSDFNNSLKLGFDPGSESYPQWMLDLPFAEALPKKMLPPGARIDVVRNARAREFLSNPECVVCTGTTDSVAAFIASGATEPGDACTSLGSTLAWKLISETRVDDGSVGIYSHKIGNQYWLVGGACNTGGNILRAFFTNNELQSLTETIEKENMFELNLFGVRDADFFKSNAGGDFGLEVNDAVKKCESERETCANDALFLCKIFSSIAKAEKRCYENANAMGASVKLKKVYTSGGGAANVAWCKMRSSCLSSDNPGSTIDVCASEYTEASYGTALLAKQGFRDKR